VGDGCGRRTSHEHELQESLATGGEARIEMEETKVSPMGSSYRLKMQEERSIACVWLAGVC